ncbi:MAG TPA: NAD-dependent epimerase/dehydratase family protein, partial [Terriglobales bacterium]|nr:NAD-dependent epimerase/dehydratase family protein [Terriglobales bacterium]
MRILAIGGTGFIGSFLVPRLQARGHEVAVLHRHATNLPSDVASIIGDRNHLQPTASAIRDFKPEIVI